MEVEKTWHACMGRIIDCTGKSTVLVGKIHRISTNTSTALSLALLQRNGCGTSPPVGFWIVFACHVGEILQLWVTADTFYPGKTTAQQAADATHTMVSSLGQNPRTLCQNHDKSIMDRQAQT